MKPTTLVMVQPRSQKLQIERSTLDLKNEPPFSFVLLIKYCVSLQDDQCGGDNNNMMVQDMTVTVNTTLYSFYCEEM